MFDIYTKADQPGLARHLEDLTGVKMSVSAMIKLTSTSVNDE